MVDDLVEDELERERHQDAREHTHEREGDGNEDQQPPALEMDEQEAGHFPTFAGALAFAG